MSKKNILFTPAGVWQAEIIKKFKKENKKINFITLDDDPNAPGHKISDIQINQMAIKLVL